MLGYGGGQTAEAGTYLCLNTGEVVTIPRGGGGLPGNGGRRYIKAPAPLLALAMPFLGLAYIIFLPFVGFAALIGYLGYRGWLALRWAAPGLWRFATLEWRPGVSYLWRRTKARESETDRLLQELEEEVARRRQEGEE